MTPFDQDALPLPLKLQRGGGIYGRVLRAWIFVIIQGAALFALAALCLLGLYDVLPTLSENVAPLRGIADYCLRVFTSAVFSAFEIFNGSQDQPLRIGASIIVIDSIALANASLHEKFFYRDKYNVVIIRSSAMIGFPRALHLAAFIDFLGQMVTTMWVSRKWDEYTWGEWFEVAQDYADDSDLAFDVRRFADDFRSDPVPLTLMGLNLYKTAILSLMITGPILLWALAAAQ